MKQVSLWLVLGIILLLAVTRFSETSNPKEDLGEIDFIPYLGLSEDPAQDISPLPRLDGPVRITVAGNEYRIRANFEEPSESGHEFIEFSTTEDDVVRYKELLAAKRIRWDQKPENTIVSTLLINIVPLLLIIGVFCVLSFPVWYYLNR